MTKRQILLAEALLRCRRRHTLTQIREKRNTKRDAPTLPAKMQRNTVTSIKLSHSPSRSHSQCQLIAANCCCCCCCCPGAATAAAVAQSTPTDKRTTVKTCKMRLGCCWLKYISVKVARNARSHHAAYEQSFNCYSFTRCHWRWRRCQRPEALLYVVCLRVD